MTLIISASHRASNLLSQEDQNSDKEFTNLFLSLALSNNNNAEGFVCKIVSDASKIT